MVRMMVQRLLDLAKPYSGVIIGVLLFMSIGVGLKIYVSHHIKAAQVALQTADKFRAEADSARADAEKLRVQSATTQVALDKANAKLVKLQAAVDKIKIPPAPVEPPASTGATLVELRAMGLELVLKPSTQLAPAVAGFTGQDVTAVWFWGKQAMRIPSLEAKVDKQTDLIAGLNKAKSLSDTMAELRTAEADGWHKAADKKADEALALRVAVTDTQKALKAERKMKYLYAFGASVLTYAVTRK